MLFASMDHFLYGLWVIEEVFLAEGVAIFGRLIHVCTVRRLLQCRSHFQKRDLTRTTRQ
jgi:hypothetical protein